MIDILPFPVNNITRKVHVYGGTIWGRVVYDYLKKTGIDVEGIYDAHLVGEKIDKKVIGAPEHLRTVSSDSCVVLCGTKGIRSMCEYLEELGFRQAYHAGPIFENVEWDEVHNWDVYEKEEMLSKYLKYINNYIGIDKDEIEISEFGIVVTEGCSLNCDKCINLIPDIKLIGPRIFDIDDQIDNLSKFLDCVKRIYKVSICGGEALLHPQLYKMINYCVSHPKISRVEILTNATVIPNDDNLKSMINPKVRIALDDYGNISIAKDELLSLCKKKGIECEIKEMKYWYDLTDIKPLNYSEEELISLYNECDRAQCFSIWGNCIVNCSVAYGSMICGKNPCGIDDDYIDLSQYDTQDEQLKIHVLQLMNRKYLNFCKYCVGTGKNGKIIEVAKQRLTD